MSTDPQNPEAEKPELSDQVSESATDSTGESPPTEQAPAGDTASEISPTDALEAEVRDLKEKLLLVHADMQNLRRRAERDVENAHKYALERFVSELVPVVDNLERATAAIDRENEVFHPVIEGVELTLKNLLDVLGRFKVEQLDPKGELFNPDKHEAMAMVPQSEVQPNTIIEVYQKGYLLNGRLVRPAMVVVAQGAPA